MEEIKPSQIRLNETNCSLFKLDKALSVSSILVQMPGGFEAVVLEAEHEKSGEKLLVIRVGLGAPVVPEKPCDRVALKTGGD